jgi:hypothetical protein
MYKVKYLTTKQSQIIEDLFTGNPEVLDILRKWKVNLRTYCRWLEQETFVAEYKRHLNISEHQKELIFARCTPSVASNLVNLTGAAKEETARKACMDVITHPDRKAKDNNDIPNPPPEEYHPEISDELASKILAVVAEHEDKIADPDTCLPKA